MKKFYITILTICIILGSIVVLAFDSSIGGKVTFAIATVKFKNSNQVITSQRTRTRNKNIKLSSNTNLDNQDINLESSGNIDNSEVEVENKYANLRSTYSNINNQNLYNNNVNTTYNSIRLSDLDLLPEDMDRIRNAKIIKNPNRISKTDLKLIEDFLNAPPPEQYDNLNIDWTTWKSRLINRITDDSCYLEELDNYPLNTPIYYSFKVDNKGNILKLQVISIALTSEDTKKFEELIKKLEHTSILNFPKDTNRKIVSLSSVLLLSDELEYANGITSDVEKVRKKR